MCMCANVLIGRGAAAIVVIVSSDKIALISR